MAVRPRARDAARRAAPRRPRAARATRTCGTSPATTSSTAGCVEMGVGDDAGRAAVRPGAARPVGRGGLRPDRHRPAPAAQARHAARHGPRRHPRRAAAAARRPRLRRPRRVLPARRSRTGPRPTTSAAAAASLPGRAGARRSGRSTSRRCRGTPSWPAGSTSSCRAPSPRRSYARPSRRQAVHARHPARRPAGSRRRRSPGCTFGVVLDTSGSMDRRCSARHSARSPRTPTARDVPAARVVFCDAAAYDAGYLPVDGDRRPGPGARAAAARSCSPASTCWSAPTTSRPTRRSWSSPTASAT